MSNSSIWPIDRTLSGATTLDQCWPGSNGNERVLHIPGVSLSDCLVLYPGHLLGGVVLPFCRDAVGIFYSSSRLGWCILGITLNCIRWWGLTSEGLVILEYPFISITPRFTLTRNGCTCEDSTCDLNRSVQISSLSRTDSMVFSLFHHLSLPSIALGKSFKLHPVSSKSWCKYILASRPTLAMFMCRSPSKNVTHEFVLASLAVSRMSHSSYLEGFWDGG